MAAVGWRDLKSKEPGAIKTIGTYVSVPLRCRGLATALWRAMVALSGCDTIYSEPVSDAGFTLLESLEGKLPGVAIYKLDRGILRGLLDLRQGAKQ
jgi:hypothetical protein